MVATTQGPLVAFSLHLRRRRGGATAFWVIRGILHEIENNSKKFSMGETGGMSSDNDIDCKLAYLFEPQGTPWNLAAI